MYIIRTMENKNKTIIENSIPVYLLAEGSPREYAWETFRVLPELPEVNHFGYSDSKEAHFLGKHRHPDTFEFTYIERGKTSWEVNGFQYETKAGDLFYTRPDEFHCASNNILEPCRLWNFGLRAPYVYEKGIEHNWMQQNSEDIKLLLDGLSNLPRVTFFCFHPLHSIRRLAKAVQQPGPFSRLHGRSAVIDLILQLLETSKMERDNLNKIIFKIEKLTNQLAFQLDQKISVKEFAEKAGISVPYFHRLFREYTRMTPRTYLEHLRIKEACRRLSETQTPITTISMDLGFATSQHFAKVFRHLTSKTPTQWRQKKMNVDTDPWFTKYRNNEYDFISLL